jgi:hypothetical protein
MRRHLAHGAPSFGRFVALKRKARPAWSEAVVGMPSVNLQTLYSWKKGFVETSISYLYRCMSNTRITAPALHYAAQRPERLALISSIEAALLMARKSASRPHKALP